MSTSNGFTIEVSSRYDGWWRYNVALMCGCFDAEGLRTGFTSITSDVAPVGKNLTEPPAEVVLDRSVILHTQPCDHLILYIYIVPHTLPSERDIDLTRPFEVELSIAYAGKNLSTETRAINQWSGASIELRIEH